MNDDLDRLIIDELRGRASALDVSPAPVDTIERKAHRRTMVMVTALASVVMVAIGAVVGTLISLSTSVPTPLASAVFDWPTRGSLSKDGGALTATRQAIGTQTQLGQEMTEGTRIAIWYAGDTAAGRVVSGAIGVPDGDGKVTRSEAIMLAGPKGADIATLRPVGNLGEPADDGVFSRVIDGRWLMVLAAPNADGMQVSWHPEYDRSGVAPRTWQTVASESGVLVTQVGSIPVAARVHLFSAGTLIGDKPVFEDSDDRNDISFFPVPGAPIQQLPAGTDLRGADADTVRWLASQTSLAAGVPVADMKVTVRWARANAALTTLTLPSGGTLAVYAKGEYIEVTPVAAADADKFVLARRTAGGAEVIAPDQPGASVKYGTATGRLDPTGYAEIQLPAEAPAVATMEVGSAGTVNLSSEDRTDPFDLG
jgi:hypothetical protein